MELRWKLRNGVAYYAPLYSWLIGLHDAGPRVASPIGEGTVHNPARLSYGERRVLVIRRLFQPRWAPTSPSQILDALNPLCVTLKMEKFIPVCFASSVHPIPFHISA
jgi:hypothetical protein